MILISIHMKVIPEKQRELTQAMTSLMASIKCRKGCLRCNLFCNVEDPNELCLTAEWESTKSLAGHLQSNLYKVLLGAMSLLEQPHETRFYSEMKSPGL
jgi:quinol monooxygenase YgiN